MFELVLFDNGLEQAVTAMVRSGFYSADEIVKFFQEIAEDDPGAGLNPETVFADVARILSKVTHELAENSNNWPEQTDNDRLTKAFKDLNESGIRAVENYGFEASDSGELYREIRDNAKWKGYCFYHNQDLVRAIIGRNLFLRFSAAADQPTNDDNRAIGKIVVGALRAHGLHPEWDGDPCKAILIQLEWQRRPDTDILTYTWNQ
jgi:hypothetical protein